MKAVLAAIALLASATASAAPPILDMHMHALGIADEGPPPIAVCVPFENFPAWDQRRPYQEVWLERLKNPGCSNPVWSPLTDEALLADTVKAMERLNIIGVLSGPPERVARWRASAPGRFLSGLNMRGPQSYSPEQIRSLFADGALDVLAEVTTQYAGIEPGDPQMEPFWALAEELDIPVGIHVGTGPPGVIYLGSEGYRARAHSALSMEEVLVRHPRLRVYLMHAGYPMIDDLLALLYAHPQVHVGLGVIVYTQPRAAFHRYLSRITEAGFADRVMFGSDQMVWPGVLEPAVAMIEDAPFLTEAQKRDILYNNAARFLRLSDEEIAAHHGR